MQRSRPRIAILVETSTEWGSGIVAGVGRQVELMGGPWELWLEPRGRTEMLAVPTDWRPDGVIARVTHPALAADLIRSGIPAVDVSWFRLDDRIPRCSVAEDDAARVAADHLANLGLRQFAYLGSALRPGSADRFGDTFLALLADRGFTVAAFRTEWAAAQTGRQLEDWLSSLPRPLGLLAFDSYTARRAVLACQAAGIDVPGEIAILAGEYDPLVGQLGRPRLSSLDHSSVQVGKRAAMLLARIMAGQAGPGESVLLPTRGVVGRESTDMLAIDDPLTAAAVQYIREHAHEGIDVAAVLKRVRISRRALEQRFERLLGRSPAAEIRRVRIQRACSELAGTDAPISEVAPRCGFEYAEVMARVFRRETGMTPSAFRKRFQG